MAQCKQCKAQFEITVNERALYKKIDVPEPGLCPSCRSRWRMSFRNERTLYARQCDLCKKQMFSIYNPSASFPVYCTQCFWSDAWDPMRYGIPLDHSKPFFEQFEVLSKTVPRIGIINKNSVNSDYCNYSLENKNCYLTFGSHREENCMYGHYSTKNKEQLDYLWTYENELCYECSFTTNSYKCVGLRHCEKCRDCYFSIDLKDCADCFLCANQRHKQYFILNKQYTKEEYFKKIAEFKTNIYTGYKQVQQLFDTQVRAVFPTRAYYQVQCEECEGTNHLNSKNLKDCFNATACENVTHGFQMDETYDSVDQNYMGYDRSELCYQTIGCTGLYNGQFCDSCWNDNDMSYCAYCFSSHDCFGCISVNKKEYVILNKEYSKEEYQQLVKKIRGEMKERGEWGNFFPQRISPFGYNESVVIESYPLEKKDALALGYSWQDTLPHTTGKETKLRLDIADDIQDIDVEAFNGVVLSCVDCKRNYKLVKQELLFYKTMSLPLPRLCPQCRYLKRLDIEKSFRLYHRRCACTLAGHDRAEQCTHEFETIYAPDRPEKVFCEQCYQKEIL